jgi:plastocyanin
MPDPVPEARGVVMLADARLPRSPRLAQIAPAAAALLLLTMFWLLSAARVGAAETATVDISGFAFSPGAVTIGVGDTVTWTNNDAVPHTATSVGSPVAFDGEMAPGESFSFTFLEAGTYDYICELHPEMEGTIVVQAAAASPGASQLPDGAMRPRGDGQAPATLAVGMALTALSLLAGAAAWRRARARR